MQEYDKNKFTMILLPIPLEKAQKFLEKDPQSFTMACALSIKSQEEGSQVVEIGNFKELGLASEQRYRRCKKILEDIGFLSLIKTCRNPRMESFPNEQATKHTTMKETKNSTRKTLVKLCHDQDSMFITKSQEQPMQRINARPYERPCDFSAKNNDLFVKKIIENLRKKSPHPFRCSIIYISKPKENIYIPQVFFDAQKTPQKIEKSASPEAGYSAKPKSSRKKLQYISFNKELQQIEVSDHAFLKSLADAYRGEVDIIHELKRMEAWCIANSPRANANLDRVFNRWVVKAYNDALYRKANGYQNQKQQQKRTELKFDPALEDPKLKRNIPF